jgi:hypothetical protein
LRASGPVFRQKFTIKAGNDRYRPTGKTNEHEDKSGESNSAGVARKSVTIAGSGKADKGGHMRDYDYDDDEDEIPDDLGWGPIIVRRPVYDEGMKLLDAAPAGEGDTFETARGIADDHKAAGEEDKADHWYAVAEYLETRASVAEGVEVVVLEEGEEWDHDRGKKIKSRKRVKRTEKAKSTKKVKSGKKVKAGKNRPRSGKGT